MLFAASFFIAGIFWLGAYSHISSNMPESQKNSPIDIKNGVGLERAKMHLDCLSIAGAAFCASAIILVLIDNRKKNKKA